MSLPKLPDGFDPLPDGAIYLGDADDFLKNGASPFYGWRHNEERGWEYGEYFGDALGSHYAAPSDSEIARLNGHVSEPAGDSEAVALVRKLAEAIRTLRGPAMDEALKEAESFLAREGKKS